MTDELSKICYTKPELLGKELQRSSPVLLVIPAISIGKPGLNDQYKDYLDQAAKLYLELAAAKLTVKLLVLGADHRGDGFLHLIGKNYLIGQYHFSPESMVWEDNKFKDEGYCSVQEAELTAIYLSQTNIQYQIITCLCRSQLTRYQLHQEGFGIKSLYFVLPDKPDYYPLANQKEEDILIEITQKDPKWESDIGLGLRHIAHLLRDPHERAITQEDIQNVHRQITKYLTKL